jgi:hypothetical protein
MDELNGRMRACQILITGLIVRVANEQPDPLRFLNDFRDEVKAVVIAQSTVDELFSLMKAPSTG